MRKLHTKVDKFMKIDFLKGNIVDIKADAVVLPANSKLKEGPGASEAIFKAAGKSSLKKACDKIGSCEVGNAVPTLAFNLDANYIIHAVVPKWIDGENNEYELLSSAYLATLNVADVLGCETVAFPLLASGNNGFDKELAFEIALKSIESYEPHKLNHVMIVLFEEDVVSIAENKGFPVIPLPENSRNVHKEKIAKLLGEGKEIAAIFLEEQLAKGIELLKDEKNRELILSAGIAIAKAVITGKKGGPAKKK